MILQNNQMDFFLFLLFHKISTGSTVTYKNSDRILEQKGDFYKAEIKAIANEFKD